MKAIRFMGACALAATLAGCAGTPGLGPSLSAGSGSEQAQEAEAVEGRTAETAAKPDSEALPDRVAAAPVPRVAPVRAAPVQAAPVQAAPVRTVPVEAAPVRTVPFQAAPVRVAPVRVAPAPRYDPVETVAAPAYEPLETVAAPEPVIVTIPRTPRYSAMGALDAPAAALPVAPPPQPVYEPVVVAAAPPRPAPGRAMAPIRDDPADGRNGRQVAEVNIHARKGYRRHAALRAGGLKPKIRSNFTPAFGMKLERAALGRINPSIRYDARYVPIGYPWGDVDETTGVCSDVVIRSYRTLGIDLQKLVHEDMKRAFRAYPSKRIYGLQTADANIDHRRVVNLEAFFERTGASIEIGSAPEDFLPGDVLTWRLSGNEPHIGIVVSDRDPRTGMPLVVHNLGAGVRKEDLISLSAPVGHFRFAPDRQTVVAALIARR